MTATPQTLGELITHYRLANPSDRRPHEDGRHAHWWMEQLGDLPLSALTTERIAQAVAQLEAGERAGSTVAFYLRFLRRVTAWGTCVLYLATDPCTDLPLPKEPTAPMRVLTEEEEAKLCQALGQPYNLWVRFAILTGIQQSEQFTLLWRSVDFQRHLVTVTQSRSGIMVDLSMPADAMTVLRTLRHLYPTSVWVFPDPKNISRPADIHNFYVSRWTRTVERLGMPSVAWKDLRHTCGVRLAAQGLPVTDITTVLRQREVRQAYRYRAWQPGELPRTPRPQHPREAVFTDLSTEELRTLLNRDLATAPLTFRELSHLYAAHHLCHRPTRTQFERMFRQFWEPWANRLADSITRKEVRIWYMSLAHIPGHANKASYLLRAVFNWGRNMELVSAENPATGLMRYRQYPRERFLSVEELQRFMAGLPTLSPKPRAFLLLLLLTGCRHGEARQMRWADLDMHTKLWTKSRTKNGTAHRVPLPIQAMDALQALPRTSEWVFPGEEGKPWSSAIAQKTWGTLRRRWNMEDVTLHDIRRTTASYLAITGENLPTIQNVLNHRTLTPTSIYARLNVRAVDRALQAQADRFCGLAHTNEALPSPREDNTTVPQQIIAATV
jgi:integrase